MRRCLKINPAPHLLLDILHSARTGVRARADPPTNHVIQASSGIMASTGTEEV